MMQKIDRKEFVQGVAALGVATVTGISFGKEGGNMKKNLVKGTVAAMIVSVGLLGSAMTAFAAPADEVSLHTTQMTFEINDGEDAHEITDAQRQQLRENLAKDAKSRRSEIDWDGLVEVTENVLDLYERFFG